MGRPRKEAELPMAVFLGKDGYWHAFVPVGGKRRHVQGKTEDAVKARVRRMLDQLAQGITPPPSRTQACSKWLTYWLETIAPLRNVEYNTLRDYKSGIWTHLIPHLGHMKVHEVETSDLDELYSRLNSEGARPKTIRGVHVVARLAFGKAVDLGLITKSPTDGATLPRVVREQAETLDPDEARRVIKVILALPRNRLRWLIRFLGTRQGETLGLHRSDLDRLERTIQIRGKAQRRTYEHGCADPRTCAKENCVDRCPGRRWEHGCGDPVACVAAKPSLCNRPRYPSEAHLAAREPCPPGCTGHARSCPVRRLGKCRRHVECKPCPADCTGHARSCPERRGGLMVVEPDPVAVGEQPTTRRRGSRRPTKKRLSTKTLAGTRIIVYPEMWDAYVNEHFAQIERERKRAGTKWVETGLLFTTELGRQLDPSRDWATWTRILEEAGVDHVPEHGGRHAVATFLEILGTDRSVKMKLMGWKSEKMDAVYTHSDLEREREAADALGTFLGSATKSATEPR